MKTKLLIIVLLCGIQIQAQNLEDYYAIAAENNPGLKSQYAQFEAAMQKVSQVNSLPDPTLSFGYFISPVETRVGPQKAKFSLNQMFPWFGTLSAQGDVATLMAEAKYQSFLDARNRLFYQVAAAYYPLYEQKEGIKIVQKNMEILDTYKAISTAKFKNGNGSLVDVLRVDILLKESQTDLEILKKKETSLLTSFNKLLNRESQLEVMITDNLAMEFMPEMYRKDSLLTDNPLLHSVDLKIKAQEAAKDVAIKQGLPKFGIGLDYVLVAERNDVDISDNGKDILMPMVSITLPIFRGKYKAAQKEAQLLQESYTYERQELNNTLTSSYEISLFEVQRQAELIALYDIQITESEQVLNLLFKDYGNSGKDFEEVLRTQKQLLAYDKLKITALAAHKVALAKLDYITSKNK